MFRVRSWLSVYKPEARPTMQFLEAEVEARDLTHAMKAATLIMNDDVDGAEQGLSDRDSTFHKVGKGVVGFVRATLGFEQEIMREASQMLSEVEISAAKDQHGANSLSRPPNAFRSEIYDPGTEFALCQAMAQVMGAVVGVLNESLTESIKGFYKLRKAFLTLNSISKMEELYLQSRATGRHHDSSQSSVDTNSILDTSDVEIVNHRTTLKVEKVLSSSNTSLNSREEGTPDISLPPSGTATPDQAPVLANSAGVATIQLLDLLKGDPESPEFSTSIDIFIHSGTSLFFGLLLLLLSMIPPAFSRLLSIIGFHGDRDKGLQMLWQASSFHSLIGAIASLALLGYYNTIVNICDIVADPIEEEPDEQLEGYPVKRLSALLEKMTTRYPQSRLWEFEAARMKSTNRDVAAAYELLSNGEASPLKQVEALRTFERSMNAMYLHRYEDCAQSFLECVHLNSWSPCLYYYMVGSAHLALYRQLAEKDRDGAAAHAKLAEEYILKAPSVAGKKRLMARQLPFDIFVTRKVAKWEARAKEWKIDLVDAVGVDPLEEMIFFWNGHNRMTRELLHISLERLAWSESSQNKNWIRESEDEKAILYVLRAAVLRALRRHGEAKAILQKHVLNHDKLEFKGGLRDDWVLPVANFEMATNLWMERPTFISRHGPSDTDAVLKPMVLQRSITSGINPEDLKLEREKVRECSEYLEKTAKWESYVLDTRIGLKVTSAKTALERWEKTHSASKDSPDNEKV